MAGPPDPGSSRSNPLARPRYTLAPVGHLAAVLVGSPVRERGGHYARAGARQHVDSGVPARKRYEADGARKPIAQRRGEPRASLLLADFIATADVRRDDEPLGGRKPPPRSDRFRSASVDREERLAVDAKRSRSVLPARARNLQAGPVRLPLPALALQNDTRAGPRRPWRRHDDLSTQPTGALRTRVRERSEAGPKPSIFHLRERDRRRRRREPKRDRTGSRCDTRRKSILGSGAKILLALGAIETTRLLLLSI